MYFKKSHQNSWNLGEVFKSFQTNYAGAEGGRRYPEDDVNNDHKEYLSNHYFP